jgi:hypothetical protein
MTRRKRKVIPQANLPVRGEIPKEPIYIGRKPGRPTSLTDENLLRFLTAVRAGNYRSVAARLCGIAPKTVERWVARGRGRDPNYPATPEYVNFVRMLDEAEAAAEALVTSNLVQRSRVDTAAAAMWLRTRHPERWGAEPVEATDPTVQTASVVNIDQRQQVVFLTPDQYPDLVRGLLAAKRAATPPEPEPVPEEEEERREYRSDRLSNLRSNS